LLYVSQSFHPKSFHPKSFHPIGHLPLVRKNNQ
jgi:hypothetical protein